MHITTSSIISPASRWYSERWDDWGRRPATSRGWGDTLTQAPDVADSHRRALQYRAADNWRHGNSVIVLALIHIVLACGRNHRFMITVCMRVLQYDNSL